MASISNLFHLWTSITAWDTLAGDWRIQGSVSVAHVLICLQSLKLAHFWSDICCFPPLLLWYIPLHDLKRAGETVLHATQPTTLFYCCFGHYQMLANKILACEVCIIWWKLTEALQNPSPIAESRTGKPAMVTLKIHLDCSTVHDTTLCANIYVCSHVGCGTDSVFIRVCKFHKYFSKTQKLCK